MEEFSPGGPGNRAGRGTMEPRELLVAWAMWTWIKAEQRRSRRRRQQRRRRRLGSAAAEEATAHAKGLERTVRMKAELEEQLRRAEEAEKQRKEQEAAGARRRHGPVVAVALMVRAPLTEAIKLPCCCNQCWRPRRRYPLGQTSTSSASGRGRWWQPAWRRRRRARGARMVR